MSEEMVCEMGEVMLCARALKSCLLIQKLVELSGPPSWNVEWSSWYLGTGSLLTWRIWHAPTHIEQKSCLVILEALPTRFYFKGPCRKWWRTKCQWTFRFSSSHKASFCRAWSWLYYHSKGKMRLSWVNRIGAVFWVINSDSLFFHLSFPFPLPIYWRLTWIFCWWKIEAWGFATMIRVVDGLFLFECSWSLLTRVPTRKSA